MLYVPYISINDKFQHALAAWRNMLQTRYLLCSLQNLLIPGSETAKDNPDLVCLSAHPEFSEDRDISK